MLGRLNHVAIAVRDAEKAAKIYGAAFGADISAAVPLPEHGVITVFVTLPNTKIEFIQPLGEASPIAKFLERNADGGIHHICYDVPDIIAARDTLVKEGARVLGDGKPRIGAHGKPVLFLHPKDFSGALVEIEQAGAPIVSHMGRKLIWTTVISAIIFASAMLAFNAGYFNIERLSKLMGIPL